MLPFHIDIKRIMASYNPSNLFVTDDEIHRMILDLDPEFSLYDLYLRYKDYGERLTRYKHVLEEEHVILEKIKNSKGLGISIIDNDIVIIHNDRMTLLDIVGNNVKINKQDGRYQTSILSIYNDYHRWLDIIHCYFIINYVNPKLRVPTIDNTYYNTIKQPIGNREFRNEYIDEIKKVEPTFLLSNLYRSLAGQKKNGSLIRADLLEFMKEHYNDINMFYYNVDVPTTIVFMTNGIDMEEEIEIKATYEEFQQLVDNLYYGLNAGYNILKNNVTMEFIVQ